MESTLADRVRHLMETRGEKAAPLALRLGFGASFVRDILRNKARSPGADKIFKLAEALGTSVDYLLGQSDVAEIDAVSNTVQVYPGKIGYGGCVLAGGFVPVSDYFSQDDSDELVPGWIVAVPDYVNVKQAAWRISGDSMDLQDIRDGMWVVAADYADYCAKIGDVENGQIVIVERSRAGEIERTVKEVQFTRDGMKLVPRSSNAAHKEIIIPFSHSGDPDGVQVKVIAVVLASFRDHTKRR